MSVCEVITLPVEAIRVGEGRRPVSDLKVEELADSIRRIGLLNPLTVTPAYSLIAGLHRLYACRSLGWETVPAIVADLDDLSAELAMIDENLRRNELSVAEQCKSLVRRTQILDALGVLAKQGRPAEKAVTVTAFSEDGPVTNEKLGQELGLSQSSVEKRLQIGRNLTDEAFELLKDSEIANSTTQLLTIARLEPEKQVAVAQAIAAGTVRTANDWLESKPALTDAQRLVSSESNEWYTPAQYIEAARQVLGGIYLDPASCEAANEVVRAERFFSEGEDGLSQNWHGRVWLNPPYGRSAGAFTERADQLFQSGAILAAIALVNSHCTDTDWFQCLWKYPLCFTDHRVNFYTTDRENGNGSTHGSVFAYLGPDEKAFGEVFRQFGTVVKAVYLKQEHGGD